MATFKGANAAIASNVNGAEKVPSGEHVGRVRCLYDSITFTQNVIAVNDVIEMGAKLQAGARVLEAVVAGPTLGATGIFDLGWAANGQDALDADGFVTGADLGGQGAKAVMNANSAGLGKKFEKETQVILTATEATAAANNQKVQIWLYYVLD